MKTTLDMILFNDLLENLKIFVTKKLKKIAFANDYQWKKRKMT